MRHLWALIAAGAFATVAWAEGDGAIEINSVRAAVGGINASLISDPPGFPVIITQPGSYRLTSNLDGAGTTSELIRISASDVAIDLNGFVLSNADAGIRSLSGFANNVTVRNGSIRGMTGYGIDLNGRSTRVESVRAIGNGLDGIGVHHDGGVVLESIAVGNGRFGIAVVRGEISGCVVAGNRGAGVHFLTVPASLVIENSAAIGNGSPGAAGSGMSVENGTVAESLIVGNSGNGLVFSTSAPGFFKSGFGRNVISGNGGASWSGSGMQTGPNLCNGSLCP